MISDSTLYRNGFFYSELPVLCRSIDTWRAYGCLCQGISSQCLYSRLNMTLDVHPTSVRRRGPSAMMQPSLFVVWDFKKFTLLIPQNSWCGQPYFFRASYEHPAINKGLWTFFNRFVFDYFEHFANGTRAWNFFHAICNLIYTCFLRMGWFCIN